MPHPSEIKAKPDFTGHRMAAFSTGKGIGEYQDMYLKKLPPWKEWGPQEQEKTLREAIGDELFDHLEKLVSERGMS